MPAWARGRMNATVILFSQGATALGGVVNKRFRARHVAWQSPNAESMRAGPD